MVAVLEILNEWREANQNNSLNNTDVAGNSNIYLRKLFADVNPREIIDIFDLQLIHMDMATKKLFLEYVRSLVLFKKIEPIWTMAIQEKKWNILSEFLKRGYQPLRELNDEDAVPFIENQLQIFKKLEIVCDLFYSKNKVIGQSAIDHLFFKLSAQERKQVEPYISHKARMTEEAISKLNTLSRNNLKHYYEQGVYLDILFKHSVKDGSIDPLFFDLSTEERKRVEPYISSKAKLTEKALLELDSLDSNKLKFYFDNGAYLDVLFREACKDNLRIVNLFLNSDYDFSKSEGLTVAIKGADIALIDRLLPMLKLNLAQWKDLFLAALEKRDSTACGIIINYAGAGLLEDRDLVTRMAGELYRRFVLDLYSSSDVAKLPAEMKKDIKQILAGARHLNESLAQHFYTIREAVAKLIFTHQITNKTTTHDYTPPEIKPNKIISNYEGYISFDDLEEKLGDELGEVVAGKKIRIDHTGSPIGYNIHLPPDPASSKGVFVHVYGGNEVTEEDKFFLPGRLDDTEKYLLDKNYITVMLNLPDELKLDTAQRAMPQELHTEIQAGIHKFFEVFTKHPEQIHALLSALKLNEKKIFLYGMSFGGTIAMRHAEIYPKSFNGYISLNGVLSAKMDERSNRQGVPPFEPWLDPAEREEINNIQDPILLLHNRDDNNVNIKNTLDFFNILEAIHKEHLARLCIFEVGGPIPRAFSPAFYKGHNPPEEKDNFLRYAETIESFMDNGLSLLPTLSPWRAYREEVLANKFFLGANVVERFMAKVFDDARLYKTSQENLKAFSQGSQNELWDHVYKPQFSALYFAEFINENEELLQLEIKRLRTNNILTRDMIKKALGLQAIFLCLYVKELYDIDLSIEHFSENSRLIEGFLNNLITNLSNEDLTLFTLDALYQANPELIMPLYHKFEKNELLQAQLKAARVKLQENVIKRKKMITSLWQQTSTEVIKNQQMEKINSLIERITKSTSSDPKEFIALHNIIRKFLQKSNDRALINDKLAGLITSFEKQTTESNKLNHIWAKLCRAAFFESPGQLKNVVNALAMELCQFKYQDQATSEQQLESLAQVKHMAALLKGTRYKLLRNENKEPPRDFKRPKFKS